MEPRSIEIIESLLKARDNELSQLTRFEVLFQRQVGRPEAEWLRKLAAERLEIRAARADLRKVGGVDQKVPVVKVPAVSISVAPECAKLVDLESAWLDPEQQDGRDMDGSRRTFETGRLLLMVAWNETCEHVTAIYDVFETREEAEAELEKVRALEKIDVADVEEVWRSPEFEDDFGFEDDFEQS